MSLALDQARLAAARGEVPVGAVLTDGVGARVLAADGNRCAERQDPTAHAEMLVLRAASHQMGRMRLEECDLYVTLEPCALCAAAISLYRLRRVYFAAYDPKGGAVEHGPRWFQQPTCLHRPAEVIGGLREQEAADLLVAFFRDRRGENQGVGCQPVC